ncbi:MAG: DNA-3-methyladenine glycosylase I [Lactobacillaceae bacterium]|jgi:DNA-3-methyladenine glycosylase I|nr:DNA-3-methyladenine glycosylase I [Lactobacillaceae bacterium]
MANYNNDPQRLARDMKNPILAEYHDEFGQKVTDTNTLFERLMTHVYAIGLKWETIVPKMPDYEKLFYNYDVNKVAGMSEDEVFEKIADYPNVIDNQGKIKATLSNARTIRDLEVNGTKFIDYLTGLVPGDVVISTHEQNEKVTTQISEQMKKDGFKYTGPSTVSTFFHGIGLLPLFSQLDNVNE